MLPEHLCILLVDMIVTISDVDLMLMSFDIAESRVVVDGVTSATVTLTGNVTLGSVDCTSFQSRLYWSKDEVLDASDIDSGKTFSPERLKEHIL